MAGFEELGLRAELVDNAREAGLETPSTMQRSVIPVLRRGGNAIIRASSGSGITPAYALALLDRFADASGTKAVVVVPTNDRAERVATTIARFAHGTNASIAALTSAWARKSNANIVVAAAERLLRAVEDSQIKLDEVECVIVDGAAAIEKLNGADVFETLFTSIPREGQRVFISSEFTDSGRRVAEAHARKALTFPPRPAVEDATPRGTPETSVRYVVAPEGRKADLIARLARGDDGPLTLVARGSTGARQAERAVRGRGFDAQSFNYDQFDRSTAEGRVIAYDPPFSAEQLTSFRSGDVIVCERDELTHLRSIAQEANVRLEAAPVPAYEPDSLNAFRNEIRRAAREEDLEAQMLVIEPLFAELSPEEIAAAATALLRSRRPATKETGSGARAGTKTWSRLFFSVGERDGIRPADMVGAITGESGVKGDEVGKVEIRDTFSVVEVDSNIADKVIRAMNGTTMKNRALRVDYDRKTATPKRGGGPPKRGMKREKPR